MSLDALRLSIYVIDICVCSIVAHLYYTARTALTIALRKYALRRGDRVLAVGRVAIVSN